MFIVKYFSASCISGGSGTPPTCSCTAGYKGNGTFCKGLSMYFLLSLSLKFFSQWQWNQFTFLILIPGLIVDALHTTSTEFDPCATDNGGCSTNANCTKTSPGERSCTCKAGYIGDGVMCLGKRGISFL